MTEKAKLCEHPETEVKYDVDRGGHYVQCLGCGLAGPPQSEEHKARKSWEQMLAWYPKRRAFLEAEQKRAGADLGDALGIKESLQFQAAQADRRLEIDERHTAAVERIAAALEDIARKPR